jgi:predicted nucleic acid-binding protein
MAAVSFDSGVLIGLDRGDTRAWAWLRRASERGEPPIVCAAAITEAWRDGARQARLARALRVCDVHEVDDPLARSAGEAIAAVGRDDPVDALVAATAARAGALLVTEDPEDMRALADGHFRSLRTATLRA